jgi:thioredoxin reductase
MTYDVVIVGGGPGGLAAALTLGRSRKRVLLCDAGPRRNAAATHVHNFVTRDGTPPDEFRRIGRAQLAPYPVEVRDSEVAAIRGARGAFEVQLADTTVTARRVILTTGMVDELPALEGLREIWGTSAIICPYCHAWEIQDRRFGYLATHVERLTFPIMLRSWSRDVVVLTNGTLQIPDDVAAQLAAARVRVDTRPLRRLVSSAGQLTRVEHADGEATPLDILFLHPPQRQVPLVASLDLALDAAGYVTADDMRQTSKPGIYAAGDLCTQMQSAIAAASQAVVAAAMLNLELTIDLATTGNLPDSRS